MSDDACVVLSGRPSTTVFLTCEHASQRLPSPWKLGAADQRLLGTHWAYDLGAAELTTELARELGAFAVLARFTRLLVDANRPEDSDSLLLKAAGGRPIELNRDVSAEDRERRLARCYRPYHAAIGHHLGASHAEIVLAVHSFTPVHEGRARAMEVGVLFDAEAELAERTRNALADAGLVVAMNEPYSGREGLIFSAARHAQAHGRRALEVEIRQDLAINATARRHLVSVLAHLFAC